MKRLLNAFTVGLPRLARYPGVMPIVALSVSLGKIAKTGHWHRFRYDKSGFWINQQREVTFYSPDLHTPTLEHLEKLVLDFWCHGMPLAPGDVVVDVGAGVGDEVIVFSRHVGPSGRVIAIEAHPVTAHCLQLAVASNRLHNTVVIQEAACDRETTLRMSDDVAHEQNAVIGGGGSISVRGRTMDAMLAGLNLQRIDLLKMNIEGAEVMALAGMKETLARTRALVVSCHDFLAGSDATDPRRTKARVTAILEEAGFATRTRPDAQRSFVRDYVYGRRREAN